MSYFDATVLQYGNLSERLNFGVILVCKSMPFVDIKADKKLRRISRAFPGANLSGVRAIITGLVNQLKESTRYETSAEFFYSVYPKMDSSIFLLDPIVGVTANPQLTLELLYNNYVP